MCLQNPISLTLICLSELDEKSRRNSMCLKHNFPLLCFSNFTALKEIPPVINFKEYVGSAPKHKGSTTEQNKKEEK